MLGTRITEPSFYVVLRMHMHLLGPGIAPVCRYVFSPKRDMLEAGGKRREKREGRTMQQFEGAIVLPFSPSSRLCSRRVHAYVRSPSVAN